MPQASHLSDYFPAEDVWERLAREQRPIVVYGMGNGADKLLRRFEAYGIRAADFFASDGFVRGHSFHGVRVKTLDEIRERYAEFVIVLSFATRLPALWERLAEMDRQYELYIPDMPVAGEAYFDRAFYLSHREELLAAEAVMADDASRRLLAEVVKYKIDGRLCHLRAAVTPPQRRWETIGDGITSYLDIGAYNGDTVREAIAQLPRLQQVTAMEPDPKNYRRLLRYAEGVTSPRIRTVQAAAWSSSGEGDFGMSGNRNSTLGTASYGERRVSVPLMRPDSLSFSDLSLIKYDVEGAEREALIGSHGLICRHHPVLSVSLYHRSEDLFALPLLLRAQYPDYRLFLCRTACVPAWELDLIAVPPMAERNNV